MFYFFIFVFVLFSMLQTNLEYRQETFGKFIQLIYFQSEALTH